MKIFNKVRVIAVFLLFLIPFLFLHKYFDELAEKREIINEELIKEQLLNEIDKFQENLKPEIYIEKAFIDLENSFGFPNLDSAKYKYTFSEENKPDYITSQFINKAKYYLNEKYGFEPFLFISSDYDLNNIQIVDKGNHFLDENNKIKYLFSCIGSILQKSLLDDFTKLSPLLDKNKENFYKVINKIYSESLTTEKKYNFISSFEIQSEKNISIFFKNIGKPFSCSSFFYNDNGNDKIYQLYNALIQKNKQNYNLLGLYYVLIKSSDISIEKLLYSACYKEFSNKSSSKIYKGIINKAIKAPNWEITNESILYEVPFPSFLYNFIADHKSISNEIYKQYFDYLQNHCLVVSIDKNDIVNDYLIYKKNIEVFIIVLLFIALIYIINIFFNFITFNISLAIKVRLIVFVAVFIPIFGLWIISNQGFKNEEKIYLNKIEKRINERMGLFDKLKDDVVNNITIDILKTKKILGDIFFNSSPNVFFDFDEVTKKYSYFFHNFTDRFYQVRIFSNLGKFYELDFILKELRALQFVKVSFLYRILSDMNLLDLTSKENDNNYGKYVLVSSYADSYFKFYNRKNDLAKEDYIVPGEEPNLKFKISFLLLATSKLPNLPKALAYIAINLTSIMKDKLNIVLNQKYSDLLKQDIGYTHVNYSIFEKSESDFHEVIRQPRIFPYRQLQLEAAKNAINKKNSGSEIIEDEINYYIKSWRYYFDNPILFVAAAVVPKSKFYLINNNILGLVFIVYVLFAVTLLSDFFSYALLEPIKNLSIFIKNISQGHLNVKINMKTGDEMEELVDSFNKMSNGLCEREKLKRFVSDKLYNSISNSEEKSISKAKVSIISSDIRSFTTITEKNNPEVVVSLLNEYFTIMEESIIKYGGSIEKIVGDAISAAFYEEKSSEYSLNACKAAIEMRDNLKKFNENRLQKGMFTIENGIGIATGEVMIGFAGKKARRREFLLIGDIIKTAEKLESMTKKAVSSKIFIDKMTFDEVKDKMIFCDNFSDNGIFYREIKL